MRFNLVGSLTKGTGVSQDIHILHGLIVHTFGKESEIRHIHHTHPHCEQADIQFFIEVLNPALFNYAAKNIWIPNQEWAYQNWKPYGKMLDEIWVKTKIAKVLFQDWCPIVKHIGWTSIDKVFSSKKNFYKAIVPVGKNVWRNPKPIIQLYLRLHKEDPELWKTLPQLNIVYDPAHISLPPIPDEISSKVLLHSTMSETAYDELLHECGVCICMSAAEGYGHAVNEAMSAGCIPILSDIPPFRQLAKGGIFVKCQEKEILHPTCLGALKDIQQRDLQDVLDTYIDSSHKERKIRSDAAREEYEERHRHFIAKMHEILTELGQTILAKYSLEDRLPKEDDLPMVSILTLTRNRRSFIPLARYCFLAQTYPQDKIEWVIVDDGTDQIKDLVSDIPNVKYVLNDDPLTIGAKRNLAVESASHDILVMMDDDDIYPNNSVLARVAHMLAEPNKQCLFSTVIPCYEIHETKSFMNIPPITLPMSERVSEATLCFTRAFWNAQKFPDTQIGEGKDFLLGRETQCRELSPQDVIVSLIHRQNTSSRKPPKMEANGCHYGLSDELFTLISEIGSSLLDG